MRLKFKILQLFFLLSITSVFAQSSTEWSKIGLSASGNNIQNGVAAFYKLGVCNNEQVVIIKFSNLNSFPVNVEWNDAVFTNELIWLTIDSNKTKKKMLIGSNQTIFGDCSDESMKNLIVKTSDFIKKADNFKLFGLKSFKVSKSK